MKNDLVKEILSKKLDCIFISPHNDDAVLSCGGLLTQLAGKTHITVVNVFTSAHAKPYTLSAQQFLKASGYSDAVTLYNVRKKEDKKVLSPLLVSVIDLGLEDALFRKKKQPTFLGKYLPEVDHIYPTYRWHILKGISKDDNAVSVLKNKLQQFKNKKNLIFAPYGIGNHVDHLIARKVCNKLFDNILFYSDYPYNVRNNSNEYGSRIGKIYTFQPDMLKKEKLIKGYGTQFSGLFPDGVISDHQEIYFSNK
jgi:LmbE family N-acetylglucosaminyl deacetylase